MHDPGSIRSRMVCYDRSSSRRLFRLPNLSSILYIAARLWCMQCTCTPRLESLGVVSISQCSTCEQRSTELWTPHLKTPNEVYRCPACEKRTAAERQCPECLRALPPSAFGRKESGHVHKVSLNASSRLVRNVSKRVQRCGNV